MYTAGRLQTMLYCQMEDHIDDEHGNLEPDLIHRVDLLDHYSQADLNHIISVLLKYASKNHTKYKTGTFVEWRDSQINFSLIGRNCSQAQRDDYAKWDKKSGDRDRAIKFLEEEFKSYGLAFRKGGRSPSISAARNGQRLTLLRTSKRTPKIASSLVTTSFP